MKRILLTQRVDVHEAYAERRDVLDQRWIELLLQAGLWPQLVPNNLPWVEEFLSGAECDGLLLTGGNSLARYGGEAPERDAVEARLLEYAMSHKLPVLGVCRGMQLILDRFGASLEKVTGHVAAQQEIDISGERSQVNSYHDWGIRTAPDVLTVWARADDGVVKAVRHQHHPLWGIMWHPERIQPFRSADIRLLEQVFKGQEGMS